MNRETSSRSLFVVDDDPGVLFLMTDALERAGYRVTTADSGGKALEWLGKNTPELVILDLNLGDMPARKLIETLRSRARMFPFVIISGHGDEHTAVQMMKEGALDYVMKDAGLMELLPGVVDRAISVLDRDRDLDRADTEQRRLEREILQISEEEKRHLGRELHDGLGQELTAVAFMNELLARSLEEKAPELSEAAQEISRRICQAIAQARRLAHGLAPAILEDGELCAALEELSASITASGVPCELSLTQPERPFGKEATIQLYRIAQEAATNALKHAKASRILLKLCKESGQTRLTIEDNGRGLSSANQPQNGMGLHVMQYRAKLIGAHLTIVSLPEGGVRVTCTLPNQEVPKSEDRKDAAVVRKGR